MVRVYKSSGQKFTKDLDFALIEQIDRVIDENKVSMIVVDGGLGNGKTTLAVELADRTCEYLTKEKGLPQTFDIKEQVCLGGQAFKTGLKNAFQNNKNVVVYDESGDFSTRKSLTNFNNELNRVFETYRAFKILVILVLPCFDDLDTSLIKKNIPRLLVNTYNRGKNSGNFRVYCGYLMGWLKHNMKKMAIKSKVYDGLTPNFQGHFLNLEPERAKELEEHSIAGKLEILDTNIDKKESNSVLDEIYISSEVAEVLGIRDSSVSAWCKTRNIKPLKKGGMNIFTKEQMKMIKESVSI
jgi:hypothetical protein